MNLTARQRKIIRAILEVLNGFEGAQLNETILHAEVNLRLTPTAPLVEFSDAMEIASNHGWVNGVHPKFGGSRLWNITDAGQGTRMELK